jgi:hypothetical protein
MSLQDISFIPTVKMATREYHLPAQIAQQIQRPRFLRAQKELGEAYPKVRDTGEEDAVNTQLPAKIAQQM